MMRRNGADGEANEKKRGTRGCACRAYCVGGNCSLLASHEDDHQRALAPGSLRRAEDVRLTDAQVECCLEQRSELVALQLREMEIADLERFARRIEIAELEVRAIAGGQRHDARIALAAGHLGRSEVLQGVEAEHG